MRAALRWLTGGPVPGPSWILAAVLLVSCFLAAAAPRVLGTVQTRVLQQTVTHAGPLEAVEVQTGWVTSPGSGPDPALLASTTRRLEAIQRPPLSPQPSTSWAGLSTPLMTVVNAAPRARPGSNLPQLELGYRDPLGRNLRMLSGTQPTRAGRLRLGHRTVPLIQVAVSSATADRFALRPGSRLRLAFFSPVTYELAPVSAVLQVTGVYQPTDPGAAFWADDSLLAAPSLQNPDSTTLYYTGGALVGPGELAILQQVFTTQQLGLIWNVGLDLTGLKAGQVPAAQAALRTEVAAGPTGVSSRFPSALTVSAPGGEPLTLFASQQAAANQVLSLIVFGLFLIGLVLTLLAGRLLVLRRGGELATLRARGGTLGAVARQVLADTAPLLVLALAAGTGAAIAISPGQGSALSWELTAVLAVAGLAGPPLLALSWCRDSATRRRLARADVTIRRRSPRRLVLEGAAVLLTAGAVFGLRFRGSGGGGGGLDLLTGLGPQLVALLAALLVLRIYPVPLRLLLRLAARRRGAAVYLGLARAARAAPAALLPALALILAMALAGFGGMVLSSVTAARTAAAWRETGADAVLTSGDLHPIPAAASRQLAAAPGVRHAVTVSTESSQVAGGGRTVNTTAVSAPLAAYAAVSSAAPFGSFAPSVLSQDHGGAIPVLVSPDLARLSGHISVLTTGVDRPLRIRVAGVLSATPAVPTGSFVIVPQALASQDDGPWPLNKVLLSGGPLDSAALHAIAARTAPHASLRLRATVLRQSIRGQPLARASQQVFLLGLAAAAVLAAAGVALGITLSAASRRSELATLAALGVRGRQARLVVALDLLPLLIVSVAGGLLSALALPAAVGPAVNLAVFVGAGQPVPVQPGLLPLLIAAAGAAVLVLLTAAGESAVSGRHLGRALREGNAQ